MKRGCPVRVRKKGKRRCLEPSLEPPSQSIAQYVRQVLSEKQRKEVARQMQKEKNALLHYGNKGLPFQVGVGKMPSLYQEFCGHIEMGGHKRCAQARDVQQIQSRRRRSYLHLPKPNLPYRV